MFKQLPNHQIKKKHAKTMKTTSKNETVNKMPNIN